MGVSEKVDTLNTGGSRKNSRQGFVNAASGLGSGDSTERRLRFQGVSQGDVKVDQNPKLEGTSPQPRNLGWQQEDLPGVWLTRTSCRRKERVGEQAAKSYLRAQGPA